MKTPNVTLKKLIAFVLATGVISQLDNINIIENAIAEGSSNNDDVLATIIVTAQRREENAQLVPISINTISGQAIADAGYQGLTDLQYMIPGLSYDPTQGAAFIIRGVGSTSFDFSNEKSVNVVVDDVVMDAQRENGLTGLNDIQRVDVLMGPQGTLFGKNSTSGVISVTTADPILNDTSSKVYVSYGQRNDRLIYGVSNLPIGDQSALRITAFDDGQDGVGRYVTLDQSLGSFSEYGIRGKALTKPSEQLQIIFEADAQVHNDTTIRTPVGGPAGTSFSPSASVVASEIALGVTPSLTNVDDADGSLGAIHTKSSGGSIHVNYKLANADLTSITAYRHTNYDNDTPADLLPPTVYSYIPFNSGKLWTNKISEELRIASSSGGTMEYVAGLFYNKLLAAQTQLQWGTLGAPLIVNGVTKSSLYALTGAYDPVTKALLGNISLFNASNETEAAFGQLKFNISKEFNIAFGARYSYDNNGQGISYPTVDPVPVVGVPVTFTATSAAPTAAYLNGSVHGSKFTYRVAPEYRFSDDVMGYITYSTGYKPAGIAYVGNKYDPYSAETVNSTEIGIKSESSDHKVRFNFDVYRSEFNDFQATILTPVTNGIGGFILASAIGNAPGLRSQGFETNLSWKATRSLTLSNSVTYTDAVYTNYVASPTANYTGTTLTNAPKWSVFTGLDYTMPLSASYTMTFHLDDNYRSDYQTVTGAIESSITAPAVSNADGTTTPNATYSLVPAHSLVNARVTLASLDDKLKFGIYARNLGNEYYSTGWQLYGALGLLHYTSLDAYRTLGAFVQYSF